MRLNQCRRVSQVEHKPQSNGFLIVVVNLFGATRIGKNEQNSRTRERSYVKMPKTMPPVTSMTRRRPKTSWKIHCESSRNITVDGTKTNRKDSELGLQKSKVRKGEKRFV
jgi:hypothetical protein